MIVGICGFKNSGKSTAGTHLVRRHDFVLISPIDPVKRLAIDLGFNEHQLWGPSHARETPHPTLTRADGSPFTARAFLDEVSASVRSLCPSFLLDRSMRPTRADVVNESVRLHIEIDAYKAAGARLILRKGGDYQGDEYDRDVAATPDSFYDAVLPRFDSLDQLHSALDCLISGWRSEAGE